MLACVCVWHSFRGHCPADCLKWSSRVQLCCAPAHTEGVTECNCCSIVLRPIPGRLCSLAGTLGSWPGCASLGTVCLLQARAPDCVDRASWGTQHDTLAQENTIPKRCCSLRNFPPTCMRHKASPACSPPRRHTHTHALSVCTQHTASQSRPCDALATDKPSMDTQAASTCSSRQPGVDQAWMCTHTRNQDSCNHLCLILPPSM